MILAVSLFTVKERCSVGIDQQIKGGQQEAAVDNHRMTLIHGKWFEIYHKLYEMSLLL